ncbi:hypothetical protein B9479_000175 [Cryptococcus floricola]|uniref:triacylglycerol lipase n=1 Tax=Cryptococcus floricola TaxID=2591691 RepID=A0A5D3B9Y4_9TREE|nr:hypothetical protein B9479_000175 [Cryptococcus floricola]
MYIPPLAYLIPFLAPAPPPPSTLTFKPSYAHSHYGPTNGSAAPELFLRDSSESASFHAQDYSLERLEALGLTQGGIDASLLLAEGEKEAGLTIRTKKGMIRRPKHRPPRITSWALSQRSKLSLAAYNSSSAWVAPSTSYNPDEWIEDEVTVPDVSDRQTLIALAKMASNAYVLPGGDGWYPVEGWNGNWSDSSGKGTVPFGWEEGADGLRGHIFADEKNETVIVSIKGTTAGVLGSGGPSAKNDKFNDNLLFSCCCARVDFSWSTVCDCYSGGNKCGQTCLEDAVVAESVYATVGTNLYNNITYMYPNATIWLTGHSLGGSVASLIGLSFGAPVVTYEAPGDLLPASRLHLPLPPGLPADLTGITHVYHTADPVPMGVCNGGYSGCYAAGFALESKCHTGETILYDTVQEKGWSVDIRTHRIGEVIDKVLKDPWPVNGTDEGKKQVDVGGGAWEAVSGLIQYLVDPARVALQPAAELIRADGTGEDDVSASGAIKAQWGWGRRGPKKDKNKKGDDDDDDQWQKHGGVPKPVSEEDCVDCFKWEFGDWE